MKTKAVYASLPLETHKALKAKLATEGKSIQAKAAAVEEYLKNQFLLMAEHLTGTPAKDIKIISFVEDEEGRMSGTIKINGHREYIHDYRC